MKTIDQLPDPGPYTPAFGDFPSLEDQVKWARECGPIYKRNSQWGTFVFMAGPEANRFVLHTGREHFSHDKGWTPIMGETLGRGLLNMDDPEHAVHRRMWNPAFTNAAMEAYVPVIQHIIERRTRNWAQRDIVDVYEESREITFDAAAAALAGFEPGPEVDKMRHAFYTLVNGFDAEKESFDDYMKRAREVQFELGMTLVNLINERRNAPADEQTRDVLGTIVRARDENGQPLDDIQILAHLNILLVAGHETTTTLGAWTLAMLAMEPEHRARIREELQAVMGNAERPTVEHLRNMPLLDAFIKETGRLHPPVFNVPRGVVSDFEFAGYRIPEGAQIRLALAAGQRLSEVFPNPDHFEPARFLPPREEDKKTPYSLVTFGGGPRICIGINFANIEVRAMAAHVLRHFDGEVVNPNDNPFVGYWTAAMPHGLKMRFFEKEMAAR
jgi:cytochrome P450